MCGLKPDDSCVSFFKSLNMKFVSYVWYKMFPLVDQYANSLCDQRCKTAPVRNSVLGMVPRIYNKLPNDINNLDIIQFKKKRIVQLSTVYTNKQPKTVLT